MILRKAKLTDLPDIQLLYHETIDHACTADYDSAQRDVWKQGTQNRERWNTAIQTQYFLLAEVDGLLAGFGSLKEYCYIDFLYTGKNFLRQGIAQLIYDQLELAAIEWGTTALTSDVSITARPFFEKQGFQAINENRHLIRGVWISNYAMRKELLAARDE